MRVSADQRPRRPLSRLRSLGRIRARLKYGFFADDFIEPLISRIESPVVFEFGAHRGEDTARICRWLRGNFQYFAWEPDRRNLVELSGVAERLRGVILVEAAVGERDGQFTFHLSSGHRGDMHTHTASSSLLRPSERMQSEVPWLRFDAAITVPVRSLDSFCDERRIGSIDLVWADVQGAEKQLVLGGAKAIRNTRYLFLEQSPVALYEGEWTSDEMMRTLGDQWGLARRFPNDVLLYNRRLVDYREMPSWRRFLRACWRDTRGIARATTG